MGALCVTFHTRSGRGAASNSIKHPATSAPAARLSARCRIGPSHGVGIRPRLKISDVIADVAAMFSVGRTFAVLTHAFECSPGQFDEISRLNRSKEGTLSARRGHARFHFHHANAFVLLLSRHDYGRPHRAPRGDYDAAFMRRGRAKTHASRFAGRRSPARQARGATLVSRWYSRSPRRHPCRPDLPPVPDWRRASWVRRRGRPGSERYSPHRRSGPS